VLIKQAYSNRSPTNTQMSTLPEQSLQVAGCIQVILYLIVAFSRSQKLTVKIILKNNGQNKFEKTG